MIQSEVMSKESKQHTKQPTIISLVADTETPVTAFKKLSAKSATAFLLESSDTDSRLARYSMIGVDPAKTITIRSGQAEIVDFTAGKSETQAVSNPLSCLSEILKAYSDNFGQSELLTDLPFTGGLVGYLGYGSTQYLDKIPQQVADPLGVPDACYGLYDSVVVFDHAKRRIIIVSHRGYGHAAELQQRLSQPLSLKPLLNDRTENNVQSMFDAVSTPLTRQQFLERVRKCKEYIEEGQVFQIVLSQRFSLPFTGDAFDVYRSAQAVNPSPYAYFLKFPKFSYTGSSPETFVSCRSGQVHLKALAGTRPRGASRVEDERLTKELKGNEKELAEHYMLVDLGRNDLGRVCTAGTVKVGEIAQVTKYAHVMHLSTDVTGRLSENKTCFDVVRSCFPRGTVSGAPKIRAMQLLSQLEPERRGIYSGAVGYFDFAGNSDAAIAIRSALVIDGQAHVNAGAGIVYDSDPDAEYEETRNKAKSIVKAIQLAGRNG